MPDHSEVPNLSRTPRTRNRYSSLPKAVRLEDTITTKESSPRLDPTAGRDPDRDFMLRYSG
jgi:hypothetical protein